MSRDPRHTGGLSEAVTVPVCVNPGREATSAVTQQHFSAETSFSVRCAPCPAHSWQQEQQTCTTESRIYPPVTNPRFQFGKLDTKAENTFPGYD